MNQARVLLCLCAASAGVASASTVVTIGETTAFPSPDFLAAFEGIQQGDPLTTYQEGGLKFTASGNAVLSQGAGYFYSGGGDWDLYTVSASDGSRLSAVEFEVVHGYVFPEAAYIRYELIRDGITVDVGVVIVDPGKLLGLALAEGFDSVRVGAFASIQDAEEGTLFQALGMDNFAAVQFQAVPAPAAAGLGALGLAGVAARRRR